MIAISQPNELDQLIAHAVAMGFPHQAEIYREVRRGRLAAMQLDRKAVAPMGTLKRAPLPCLVVLGDDDYASTGPAGWASVPRLLRWARGALIHATGADIASYKMAVGMALKCRQFLLIETDFPHMREWGEALLAAPRPVPFVALQPSNGVHPVMPARGKMQ